MDQLSATTELEAVNLMLGAIGSSPINSLDNSGVVDAVIARTILRDINRTVQTSGWHFNTEKDIPLTPAFPRPGEIALPTNCMRVDSYGADWDRDVVQRGLRLYDLDNHTYLFSEELKAEMVILLPFDELPEAARQYISYRASRVFQDRMLGSETLHQFNRGDEQLLWMALLDAEGDTEDHNILRDNYSVARILDR